MLNHDVLVAPSENGGVLLEPSPVPIAAMLAQSVQTFHKTPVTILGRLLTELRNATRMALAGYADRPVWTLGHQPEFLHAGVWAKHIAADRLARRGGGVAVHLIVDNDVPADAALRVPERRDNRLTLARVPVPTADAQQPFEHWPALSDAQQRGFAAEVRAAFGDWFETSLLPTFFEAMSGANGADYVDQFVAGRRAIDALAGVNLVEHRVSAAFGGPLVGQMMVDAPRFVTDYNAALSAYRTARGIRGTTRPIPDLAVDGDRVELPLWVYGPQEPRRRLFVAARGDAFDLYADDATLVTLTRRDIEAWCDGPVSPLPDTDKAVRPRALSLTLWARLLLTDVFIHGIGGAKYDAMTDDLMRRYFGIEPPPILCASATLRLPFDREDPDGPLFATVQRRLRDWQYNPQRVMPGAADVEPAVAERSQLVERSRRLRDERPRDHAARRAVFQAIRSANERIRAAAPILGERLHAELDRARRRSRDAAVADSREFFVGLFPRPLLERLTAAVDERLSR